MKSQGANQKQKQCFLNEQGVVITKTHLTTPGHSIEFAKIRSVRVIRDKPWMAFLFRQQRSFHLPVLVFKTQDAEFIKRIEMAMDQAAVFARGEKVK